MVKGEKVVSHLESDYPHGKKPRQQGEEKVQRGLSLASAQHKYLQLLRASVDKASQAQFSKGKGASLESAVKAAFWLLSLSANSRCG